MIDPSSVVGKAPPIERRVPFVVVGAGAAGVAAALEAVRAGVEVMLIDENPLDPDLMAMDVPHYFGQRMSLSARNRALMLERVIEANPGLGRADEAGVDVQLGVSVWGAFRNGPTQRELAGPVPGLAEGRGHGGQRSGLPHAAPRLRRPAAGRPGVGAARPPDRAPGAGGRPRSRRGRRGDGRAPG